MKTLLVSLFLSILLLVSPAIAHPGATDVNGCHTNRQTGEYHCHSHSENAPKALTSNAFTVVSTGDGDTIRVKDGDRTVTVRLACVDAPETKQAPWGTQSASRLKELLPAGQAVTLRTIATDQYGRNVAEVFKGDQSVNLQLIEEGQAVVYRQFLKGCDSSLYLQAEAKSKQQKRGFWNQSNPNMPWVFRRQSRNAAEAKVRDR